MSKDAVGIIRSKFPASFSCDIGDIPEAKKWEVGKKYQLTLKVELTGINKEEYYEDEESGDTRVRFDILKIKEA